MVIGSVGGLTEGAVMLIGLDEMADDRGGDEAEKL